METKLFKNQMAGIKPNDRAKNSVLNLYGTDTPYSLGNLEITETLSHPEYVSQVTLINDYTYFDMKLSFKEDSCVAITRDDDQYIINDDVDFESVFLGLQMYTGNSVLRSSALNLKLSLAEANLLASIIDTLRGKRNLIGKIETTFTDGDLVSYSDNEDCLSAYMQNLTGTSERGGLNELILKQVVKLDGNKFQLTGDALNLLYSFTSIDNLLEVTATTHSKVSFTFVQSGLNTVVCLERTTEGIHLRTMAPAVMLEVIDELLIKNEKLMAIAPQEKAKVESAGPKNFCSNCGTKVKDDAKFCASCGTKI